MSGVVDVQLADTREFVKRETGAMLAREHKLADWLSHRWACDLRKLRTNEVLDYAAERDGRPVAWVEVKLRNNTYEKYPTYMISLRKLCMGLLYNLVTGHPFILVVGFTNGVYRWQVDDYRETDFKRVVEAHFHGTFKRNWSADLEMCAFIDLKKFKEVAKWK